MQRIVDQHTHSRFSMDSRSDPADNVAAARRAGLGGVTFTEHYDTHPDDWPGCVYDDQAIAGAVDALKEQYAEDLFVGKGIEVCYQQTTADDVLAFLAAHRFDMVILSVHYFEGRAIHLREHWEGLSTDEVAASYFRTVVAAVRWAEAVNRRRPGTINVLGHLDLVKRYAVRFRGSYDPSPHGELIDGVLAGCLSADVVPEVNTSGIRQGAGGPMPDLPVLRRYAELGGTVMSLGSDAHVASDIGADFDAAVDKLAEAGLSGVAVFRSREREDVQLADVQAGD